MFARATTRRCGRSPASSLTREEFLEHSGAPMAKKLHTTEGFIRQPQRADIKEFQINSLQAPRFSGRHLNCYLHSVKILFLCNLCWSPSASRF